MSIIKKLSKDKLISKSSSIANNDICETILKHIVDSNEQDYVGLDKNASSDEKIELYLFYKNILTYIIETEVKTENYSFKHYSCCFLDNDLISVNFAYILYEDKLYSSATF
jgi:hypothetical protein